MYKIERRPSGYILTFSGTIETDEMFKWKQESEKILSAEQSETFGVIIDMRNLIPLSLETNKILISGQRLYKEKGMKRSAVILNSEEICQKLKNTALQSGIYTSERYINATGFPDATDLAIKWVKDGIDPDLN